MTRKAALNPAQCGNMILACLQLVCQAFTPNWFLGVGMKGPGQLKANITLFTCSVLGPTARLGTRVCLHAQLQKAATARPCVLCPGGGGEGEVGGICHLMPCLFLASDQQLVERAPHGGSPGLGSKKHGVVHACVRNGQGGQALHGMTGLWQCGLCRG